MQLNQALNARGNYLNEEYWDVHSRKETQNFNRGVSGGSETVQYVLCTIIYLFIFFYMEEHHTSM